MASQDEIRESIETLLDEYFESQLNKSEDGEKEEAEEAAKPEEEEAAEDDKEEAKDSKEDDVEKSKSEDDEDKDDDEEDEDDEDEDDDDVDKSKKKKVKKSNHKWTGNTKDPQAVKRPASLTSKNGDMIPDADGDMTPEKTKGKSKMKKSQDANIEAQGGISEEERAELEAYRTKERERQATVIQKSIEAEKDAQEKRFKDLEEKFLASEEKVGQLEKALKTPAYRRLSRSGAEPLAKSENGEELNKTASIGDVVLAKSHSEAAKVFNELFKMQEEGLCQAKHIAQFENQGDINSLEIKTALVGRLGLEG